MHRKHPIKKLQRPIPVGVTRASALGAVLGFILLLGGAALAGTSSPAPGNKAAEVEPPFSGQRLEIPKQTVAPGEVILTLRVILPPDYKPNLEPPSRVKITATEPQVLSWGQAGPHEIDTAEFPLDLKLQAQPGETLLTVDLRLSYCKTGKSSLCLFKEVRLVLPVQVAPGAPARTLEAAYQSSGP